MEQQVQILPKGWIEKELGEIVNHQKGKLPKSFTDKPQKGYLPYIDIKAFEDSKIRRYAAIEKSTITSKNDVLVVWDGARFGLSGIGMEGVLGSTLVRIDSPILDTKLLYYFIHSKYSTINSRPRGSGTPHVEPNVFWPLKVSIAPLNEQKRIVDKIETLFSDLDKGEENLRTAQRQLATYRQSVLKAAMSGELIGIDSGAWPKQSLSELITDIRYGTAKKCWHDPSKTAVLRIPNVVSGKIDLTNLKHTDFEPAEIKKLALKEGDVLLVRSNGSASLVGRSAVVGKEAEGCVYAGYLIRLRLKQDRILPDFLHLFLLSPGTRAHIERQARSTSGVHNINSDEVKNLSLFLPSIDEQLAILDKIEDIFSRISTLETWCATELTRSATLRQSILKAAFSGQLVPQDASDEPASELLKRIQAERASAPKATAKRGRPGKRRAA